VTEHDEPRLINYRDASFLLGVSPDTVRRVVNDGGLSTVRIGKSVRLVRDEVIELAERGYTKREP
jgi:excisionase family DNA binding protein